MKNRAQYILIFVSIVISVLLLIGIWSSKKTASTELYGCISMEKEDVKTFLSDNKLTDKDGTGIYLSKALMVTLNDEGRIDTLTVLAPGYTFCGIEVGDTYNHSVDSRKLSNNNYQFIEKNNLREVVYCRADGNEERDQIIWLSTDTYGIVTQITFSRTGAQAYTSYAAGEMQYEQTAPDTDSTEMALYEYTEEEAVANEYRTMYVVNCNESITLRTSPSTSASEICQIPLGAAVSYVESAANGFYKVVYLGNTGYALASYLQFQ